MFEESIWLYANRLVWHHILWFYHKHSKYEYNGSYSGEMHELFFHHKRCSILGFYASLGIFAESDIIIRQLTIFVHF